MTFSDVGGVKRILVVDDEDDLRHHLLDFFTERGYETTGAESGHQAWALLNTKEFDLVLSDITMPNGDGVWLLDQIRNKNADFPPVVLMSGYAKISVAEAYEKGADAFFPKPFNAKSLLKTVEEAFETKVERWRKKGMERLEVPERELTLRVATTGLLTAAYSATILNIGRGGMFLAWGLDFPSIGEQIHFSISFLGEPLYQFEGIGVVRWVRTEKDSDSRLPGFGIEFTKFSDGQAIHILDVINYLKTKEFIPR
jgi:CheY-like chemotaxis protein/Tfp pilus assembly protein PilZ